MQKANAIRVLILDCDFILRCEIESLIGAQDDMTLVPSDACAGVWPDVVVLGIDAGSRSPDETVARLRRSYPAVRVLLLSNGPPGDEICRALEAGAAGCVLANEQPGRMLEAIRAVHAGRSRLCAEAAACWWDYRNSNRLSDDQMACLRLLAAGKSEEEIAVLLRWEGAQVRRRLGEIGTKFRTASPGEMVAAAMREGILTPE